MAVQEAAEYAVQILPDFVVVVTCAGMTFAGVISLLGYAVYKAMSLLDI